MYFGIAFKYPQYLLLLIVPLLFAGFWVWQHSKRQSYAVKFADIDLLGSIRSRVPTYKQLIPGIATLLSLGLVIIALAGPQEEYQVEVEGASVILAFDTSISMLADDVTPDRFTVAKEAAKKFVAQVPQDVRLGLLFFNQDVTPSVTPQLPREPVITAIDNARINYGTALGDAIITAISMLQADQEVYKANAKKNDNTPEPIGGRQPEVGPSDTKLEAATIVILSDGETTAGNPAYIGANAAKDVEVPISTISFGTKHGRINNNGHLQAVPANEGDLRHIAKQTGGKFFRALDEQALTKIFEDLGRQIGKKTEYQVHVLPWLAAAVALSMIAIASHLIWFRRVF